MKEHNRYNEGRSAFRGHAYRLKITKQDIEQSYPWLGRPPQTPGPAQPANTSGELRKTIHAFERNGIVGLAINWYQSMDYSFSNSIFQDQRMYLHEYRHSIPRYCCFSHPPNRIDPPIIQQT